MACNSGVLWVAEGMACNRWLLCSAGGMAYNRGVLCSAEGMACNRGVLWAGVAAAAGVPRPGHDADPQVPQSDGPWAGHLCHLSGPVLP